MGRLEDYRLLHVLGSGHTGQVYLAMTKATGAKVRHGDD
jgi:serine/threonine protein kinase